MTPYNEDSSEHRARLFFRGCVGYENKLTRHFADCRALDLSNPTIATSRLDEDERAKFNLGRQWVKKYRRKSRRYATMARGVQICHPLNYRKDTLAQK